MIERLLASSAPTEELADEDQVEAGDDMKLTSLQSITDFMTCAGRKMCIRDRYHCVNLKSQYTMKSDECARNLFILVV